MADGGKDLADAEAIVAIVLRVLQRVLQVIQDVPGVVPGVVQSQEARDTGRNGHVPEVEGREETLLRVLLRSRGERLTLLPEIILILRSRKKLQARRRIKTQKTQKKPKMQKTQRHQKGLQLV